MGGVQRDNGRAFFTALMCAIEGDPVLKDEQEASTIEAKLSLGTEETETIFLRIFQYHLEDTEKIDLVFSEVLFQSLGFL